MAVYAFETRVSYDDIDADLSLSVKGVLNMLQEAAIIHADKIGYSMRNVHETGVAWILVQWRVRLLSKAYWDQNVTVRTWPRTMERAKSERDFEIVSEDGNVVAIGESVWVLVSTTTGRIVRITPEIASAYDLTERRVFSDVFLEPDEEVGTEKYCGTVMKRDIDTNGHVNNRVYLEYACEALPDDFDMATVKEVYIHYRRQLLSGQRFRCCYKYIDCAHVIDILCIDSDVKHCTVILKS